MSVGTRFIIVRILTGKPQLCKPQHAQPSDIRIQNNAIQLTTDHDWLEHHARYFSAAILMPYPAVRIAYREYTKYLDLWYKT